MSEEMTSRERCLATIRFEPHDRIPVDLHNFMMTVVDSKLPNAKLYQDGQLLGEAQVAAWKRFGHDMLLIENGTATLAEACGCEVSYPHASAPRIENPFLKGLGRFRGLGNPIPGRHPCAGPPLKLLELCLIRSATKFTSWAEPTRDRSTWLA